MLVAARARSLVVALAFAVNALPGRQGRVVLGYGILHRCPSRAHFRWAQGAGPGRGAKVVEGRGDSAKEGHRYGSAAGRRERGKKTLQNRRHDAFSPVPP